VHIYIMYRFSIYVNRKIKCWYSKNRKMVGDATFRIHAMKRWVWHIQGTRYVVRITLFSDLLLYDVPEEASRRRMFARRRWLTDLPHRWFTRRVQHPRKRRLLYKIRDDFGKSTDHGIVQGESFVRERESEYKTR